MRRLLIAIAVAFLGMSSAYGKPRAAVAPIAGDSGGEMGEAVREALGGKLAIMPAKEVARAMSKLDLSGELDDDQLRKLRERLDAAVVVHGKLGRSGKKKTVRLTVAVRGKEPSSFTVQYKSAGSEKFRDTVREALLKRIGTIRDSEDSEDRPKKKVADDGGDGDEPKKKKKKKKKVASADNDDDDGKSKVRKRKRAGGDDDDDDDDDDGDDDDEGDGEGVRERPARPLPAARVDVGFSYGARYLTYTIASDSPSRPPKVLTPAPSGRVEGEIYPLAFSNRESPLAGIGIYGAYAKTFGLSIEVPDTMGKSTPINQASYAIGLRYRLPLGKSAIFAGAAYTRRHYIADRSSLDAPAQLDAPDVDYAAISPAVGARTQVASRVALFAELDAMLVLAAGAITESPNYGAGDVFGIGATGGIDIALGKQIGLRLAGEYNQISLKFKGTGTMASARKVSAASDRDFGGSATFAAFF